MTGVPPRTDMHFRNGAVAISYVSTLLLLLVDEKKVSLDDKVSTWLPELPHSRPGHARPARPDDLRLRRLRHREPGRRRGLYADPFRQWTPEELLAYGTSKPLLYPPGHELELRPHQLRDPRPGAGEDHRASRWPDLLQEKVLGPLGLTNTGELRARRPSPSRRCTRSPPSAGWPWVSRPARRSTRNPPTGTRPGRSPTAPSRPRTSSTSKTQNEIEAHRLEARTFRGRSSHHLAALALSLEGSSRSSSLHGRLTTPALQQRDNQPRGGAS